jgi:PTS system arbutin-like IIC component
MREKIQKFGGAMFTPVMLLSFSGIILALTIIFKNPMIMGNIAEENTLWFKLWDIVSAGMWTVFNNLELLFVIALPIGLAKKSPTRISMESFVVYMSFNYFIGAILNYFGSFFGVDYSLEPVTGSGMKLIGGIKTLDTGIVGAIVIALLVVYLHNRLIDKKVPDWLGMFNGSSLVVFIGMLGAIATAVIFCFIWPLFQRGMGYTQAFFVNSGALGIWCYSLLERLLLPTGLHHLLTQPFSYGPVIVDGGITTYWLDHLVEFSRSTKPLAELFPGAAFKLYGHNKIFAAPGVAAALYFTAKSENKKKVAALVIPAALAAVVGGITEPLEFTFLFISPMLYGVYAVLCATLSTTMYLIGIRGDFTSGIITWLAKNWIPLWHNHHNEYLKQIVVGLLFTVIFFAVFYFIITKFDIQTPGRQLAGTTKLYTKKDYKQKKNKSATTDNNEKEKEFEVKAKAFLIGLAGKENIESVTNCATRLRIIVHDAGKVADNDFFMENGALGVVRKNNSLQIIVGISVPQVRDAFEKLL